MPSRLHKRHNHSRCDWLKNGKSECALQAASHAADQTKPIELLHGGASGLWFSIQPDPAHVWLSLEAPAEHRYRWSSTWVGLGVRNGMLAPLHSRSNAGVQAQDW